MKATLNALFLLAISNLYAQTFSSGLLPLSSSGGTALDFSAIIDVNATEVTLTIIGSDAKWFGIGFGTSSMMSGGDVVIFDGTALTDRTFQGIGTTPTLDANQDWNVISNVVDAGVRTVMARRALSTADANDYVFSAAASTITMVYAQGFSLSLGYHGSDNYGFTTSNLTLNTIDIEAQSTKIYPNPTSGSLVVQTMQPPTTINVYSHAGQLVKSVVPDAGLLHQINISELPSGIYMVEVQTQSATSWSKIIVK